MKFLAFILVISYLAQIADGQCDVACPLSQECLPAMEAHTVKAGNQGAEIVGAITELMATDQTKALECSSLADLSAKAECLDLNIDFKLGSYLCDCISEQYACMLGSFSCLLTTETLMATKENCMSTQGCTESQCVPSAQYDDDDFDFDFDFDFEIPTMSMEDINMYACLDACGYSEACTEVMNVVWAKQEDQEAVISGAIASLNATNKAKALECSGFDDLPAKSECLGLNMDFKIGSDACGCDSKINACGLVTEACSGFISKEYLTDNKEHCMSITGCTESQCMASGQVADGQSPTVSPGDFGLRACSEACVYSQTCAQVMSASATKTSDQQAVISKAITGLMATDQTKALECSALQTDQTIGSMSATAECLDLNIDFKIGSDACGCQSELAACILDTKACSGIATMLQAQVQTEKENCMAIQGCTESQCTLSGSASLSFFFGYVTLLLTAINFF